MIEIAICLRSSAISLFAICVLLFFFRQTVIPRISGCMEFRTGQGFRKLARGCETDNPPGS
jgi:hypothetical protein